MNVSHVDALSLLLKYAEERAPVLAALVTHSLTVARVTGMVRLSKAGDITQLVIGEDEQTSDQIKFLLSNCLFEYGDFRDEPDAERFEAFLVIASNKGDTLSLFETRR